MIEDIEGRHEGAEGDNGRTDSLAVEFSILVGNEVLEFRPLNMSDPMPTGRQIMETARFHPVEEYLIFVLGRDRQLNELELGQTVDLRDRDVERFLVFRSDRSWRGVIDGKRFEWGAREILGRVLKWLAGVNRESHGIWLERRDEPDLLIGDEDQVNLSPTGVERFRTGLLNRLCIEGKTYPWPRDTIKTEEIAALGGWDASQGVIEVDKDQNERNLAPGEEVRLRPGVSFGKKLCFKRG